MLLNFSGPQFPPGLSWGPDVKASSLLSAGQEWVQVTARNRPVAWRSLGSAPSQHSRDCASPSPSRAHSAQASKLQPGVTPSLPLLPLAHTSGLLSPLLLPAAGLHALRWLSVPCSPGAQPLKCPLPPPSPHLQGQPWWPPSTQARALLAPSLPHRTPSRPFTHQPGTPDPPPPFELL